MIELKKKLAIHVALFCVLAALLMSHGQENYQLALIVFAAASISVYATDIKGKVRFDSGLANVAALVAMGITLHSVLTARDEAAKLAAIANLLIYLEVVLFFQKKDVRVLGQLLMLSVLQVVVAAALSYSLVFAVLLVAWLVLGVRTMMLFFFYREMQRLNLADEDSHDSFFGGTRRTTWFAPRPADRHCTAGTRTIGRTSLVVSTLTLVFTVAVFYLVPRIDSSTWDQDGVRPTQQMVGYSQRVTLGELGQITQNPEVVMRVQFVPEGTDSAIRLHEPPLLRGSVLMQYSDRQWSEGLPMENRQPEIRAPLPEENVVLQNILLEPLESPVVFSVYPAVRAEEHGQVYQHTTRPQLVRPQRLMRQQYEFILGTSGIEHRRNKRFIPQQSQLDRRLIAQMDSLPELSPDPLAGLKQVADDVAAAVSPEERSRIEIAQALEKFLREDGGFGYSLMGQNRAPQLDPIEDFVVNNRVGHCEYFASALTLMLRQQGIPSRMIIGFKADEWNSIGRYYQVRQLHAHTWVEAYFTAEELTAADVADPGDYPNGAWMVLDPTSSEIAPGDNAGLAGSIRSLGDYINMLWSTYVVGLTHERQQRDIYGPVADASEGAMQDWLGDEVEASGGFGISWAWRWLRGNWLSWRGGLLAIIACGMIYAMIRVARVLVAWYRARHGKQARTSPGQRAENVAFYHRLEHLLALHGLRRGEGQTPRELATVAGGELAESPSLRSAASLPRKIVDAYYRVRYGDHPLDSQETEAVEHALDELQSALRQRPHPK